MKYYKNPVTGEVFAYESDGSQDEYILPELVPMTGAEVDAHLTAPSIDIVPTLTPRQIRFVLNSYNLRQAVESAVAAADQTTKDWWEFSLDYQYDHPVLQAMAAQLGLTQDQVKQMFIQGSQL